MDIKIKTERQTKEMAKETVSAQRDAEARALCAGRLLQ